MMPSLQPQEAGRNMIRDQPGPQSVLSRSFQHLALTVVAQGRFF